MNIDIQDSNDVKVIVFDGSLDTNTSAQAESTLGDVVEQGADKVLINFTALDFISSAGLRVLLVTAKKLGDRGGSLRLCGLNESVSDIFEISGFDTLLKVFESEQVALAGF
ncbi:MAG: anti-sigma B factor antagonist [Phycisphaerales bacterium]|jgi:anti-sigma B factor antagonist